MIELKCLMIADLWKFHQRAIADSLRERNRSKMSNQVSKPLGDIPFAPRDYPGARRFRADLNQDFDGFDNWWNKTLAQQTAVVAQASSLMRAHRRANSPGVTRAGQVL
jgi:hypothetical protein